MFIVFRMAGFLWQMASSCQLGRRDKLCHPTPIATIVYNIRRKRPSLKVNWSCWNRQLLYFFNFLPVRLHLRQVFKYRFLIYYDSDSKVHEKQFLYIIITFWLERLIPWMYRILNFTLPLVSRWYLPTSRYLIILCFWNVLSHSFSWNQLKSKYQFHRTLTIGSPIR